VTDINPSKDWRSQLPFWERYFGGHVNIGPVTIFGENAMHWAVNIKTTRWGYVCFRLPLRSFGRWWPLYWYCSPDATPQAATFIIPRNYR
jgi:hypothetical protein